MVLHPGQGYSIDVPIAVVVQGAMRRFVLDRPGRYEFRLRYRDGRKDGESDVLESDVLRVKVIEPPSSEVEALAAYTPELAAIAQEGMDRLLSPEETQAAAGFVERFPHSLYAAPVRSGLRSALERSRRNRGLDSASRRLHERLFGDEASDSPPSLNVSLSTSTLWPADKGMVPIVAGVKLLDYERREDLTATVSLASIGCDDSCDLEDAILGAEFGSDDRSFELRADRGRSGVGRTYTVKYVADSATGHHVTATATVRVPHDQDPSPWSAAEVLYRRGDVVTHEGYTWRATEEHTSSPRFVPGGFPTVGPFWVKLPRGRDWDYPVRYEAGAEVTFGGSTFRCREAHISQGVSPPPSNPGRWERIR